MGWRFDSFEWSRVDECCWNILDWHAGLMEFWYFWWRKNNELMFVHTVYIVYNVYTVIILCILWLYYTVHTVIILCILMTMVRKFWPLPKWWKQSTRTRKWRRSALLVRHCHWWLLNAVVVVVVRLIAFLFADTLYFVYNINVVICFCANTWKCCRRKQW